MPDHENIPQENLEKGNHESEKVNENISGQETIEQPQTEINKSEIPKSEIENMEVHHHTHSGHGKKTLKEYFWEFLMLFLAVFCGFLAEYKLEHTLEHQRENQYAKLLLSDLRADSLYFADRTKLVETRFKKHQQFYELMTSPAQATDKQILNAFLPLFYTYDLKITPATYNQMKTSGSLRYIQNEKLINALQQYYEVLIPRDNQSINLNNQYYATVIYPFFLNHFRIQDIDDDADSVKVANPVILNRTKETDQELLNITESYGSDQRHFQNRMIVQLTAKNKELINSIKEGYYLK